MKKLSVLVATAIVALGAFSTSCGDARKSASLKTSVDSASYAIGISTGAGYKENLKTLPGGEANIDDLIAGFIQALEGDSSAMKMTPQEAQQYFQYNHHNLYTMEFHGYFLLFVHPYLIDW